MIQQKKYNQAFDLLLGAKGKTCDSLNRVIDEQVVGLYTQMQKQEANAALTSNCLSEHDSFVKPRLSFAQGKYFFVNKADKRIKKLGEWKTAMRFDENYYALVKNQKGTRYYLDTLGNTYRVAFSPQELSPDITALDLSDYEKYKRAQTIFNQPQLKILIFGVGGMPFLPKEIGKLSNLEVLQVYFSKFIRYAAGLKNIPQMLRALNIDGYFEYIPVEIEQLTQLEHLNIWYPFDFMGFPIKAENLTKLHRLKSLELIGSYEEILPQIGRLTQLRCLRLTGHYTKIPPELSQLTQLETLHLQGNFTQIPTQLIQHAPLTKLWLIGKYTQVPAELGQLT